MANNQKHNKSVLKYSLRSFTSLGKYRIIEITRNKVGRTSPNSRPLVKGINILMDATIYKKRNRSFLFPENTAIIKTSTEAIKKTNAIIGNAETNH
jgi:predicted metal-dependent phosphotriesterase family hydrolase